ncbi:hypothetical protein SAMN05444004_1125 [Jannaschia faecimaris]|uniref:Uncharacterized protein n=1 Tax=Jannaschia faecimaris TaxID=1244108 RepID=A0A1H3SGN6_9RHOB|nr:hypothetical protein [Jannaschia faecimaris]SDZ37223.1 hypothetical protein SAMN05444004_1125 [Jannaschia faecimaris]
MEEFFPGTLVTQEENHSLWYYLYSVLENPPTSPLVLDLDGDGIELTSVNGATAFFDVGADGFAEATGWVAADDGMLALDVDGNGIIDDGSERYGERTFAVAAMNDGFADFAAVRRNLTNDCFAVPDGFMGAETFDAHHQP